MKRLRELPGRLISKVKGTIDWKILERETNAVVKEKISTMKSREEAIEYLVGLISRTEKGPKKIIYARHLIRQISGKVTSLVEITAMSNDYLGKLDDILAGLFSTEENAPFKSSISRLRKRIFDEKERRGIKTASYLISKLDVTIKELERQIKLDQFTNLEKRRFAIELITNLEKRTEQLEIRGRFADLGRGQISDLDAARLDLNHAIEIAKEYVLDAEKRIEIIHRLDEKLEKLDKRAGIIR